MRPSCVGYRTGGAVAVVSLRRPEVRNAVDHRVAVEVERALDLAEGDPDVRVVVITGDGPVFCAGADLGMIAAGAATAMTARGGFAGVTARERTKPLIAAVEGAALAGGFEIVLACDLVVAADGARFGIPEVRRGLVAGAGGLVRLPHRVPRNVAAELALLGGTIPAARALELGLVNRVVAAGGALAAAVALAEEVAANPAVAVAESRAVLDASASAGEAAGWQRNERAMARVQATEDFAEGPRAFLEKRPPIWRHR